MPRSWKPVVELPCSTTAKEITAAAETSSARCSSWFRSFLDSLQTYEGPCPGAAEDQIEQCSEADGNFIRFNCSTSGDSSICATLMVALPCPPEPQEDDSTRPSMECIQESLHGVSLQGVYPSKESLQESLQCPSKRPSMECIQESLGCQECWSSTDCEGPAAPQPEYTALPTSAQLSQVEKVLQYLIGSEDRTPDVNDDTAKHHQKGKSSIRNKTRTPISVVNLGLETSISSFRTKLKSKAPAFHPMQADPNCQSKLDIAANNLYLSLVSCGQMSSAELQKGRQGISPASISIQVQESSSSFSKFSNGYRAVLHAQKVLDEITTQMDNVKLLSNKVREEGDGYSLEAAMACLPSGADSQVCWDLLNKGWCPRRGKCNWYHPQENDIGRINLRIKCTGYRLGISKKKLAINSPPGRFTLPLNALLI